MFGYTERIIAGCSLAAIIGVAVVAGIAYAPLESTVSSATFSCLIQVPQDSKIYSIANYTIISSLVVYPNDTQAIFPVNSCPQPAQPELYAVVQKIEKNSTFLRAENGTNYIFDSAESQSTTSYCDYDNCTMVRILFFDHWSNLVVHDKSGDTHLYDLAEIRVTIPLNSIGEYVLGGMTFSNVPASDLNGPYG